MLLFNIYKRTLFLKCFQIKFRGEKCAKQHLVPGAHFIYHHIIIYIYMVITKPNISVLILYFNLIKPTPPCALICTSPSPKTQNKKNTTKLEYAAESRFRKRWQLLLLSKEKNQKLN